MTSTVTQATVALITSAQGPTQVLFLDGIVSVILLSLLAIRQIGMSGPPGTEITWIRTLNLAVVPLLLVHGILIVVYLASAVG